MKKELYTIILILIAIAKGYSQVSHFNNTYDFQGRGLTNLFYTGMSISQDSLVYIPGTVVLGGNQRAAMSVINVNTGQVLEEIITGDTVSNVAYGGGGIVNYNGAIYISGFKKNWDTDTTTSYLYKYRDNQMVFQIEYDFGHAISGFTQAGLITYNNSLYVTGTAAIDSVNQQGIVVQLDTSGNVLNYKEYGGTLREEFDNIDTTIGGGFILSGWTTGYGGIDYYGNFFLIKVDSNLNFVWQKTFGFPGLSPDYGMAKTLSNGDIIVYGGFDLPSTNYDDAWIARLNSTGDIIWQEYFLPSCYYMTSSFSYLDVIELDNSYLATLVYSWDTVSHTTGGIGILRPVGEIVVYNSLGEQLFSRTLKIRATDNYPQRMIQTNDGGFLINGYVFPDDTSNTEDGWLIKLDDHFCDVDTCTGFDITIGLPSEVPQDNNWLIYPNPTNQDFFIQKLNDNLGAEYNLSIYTLLGGLILKENLSQNSQLIHINDLSSGMYVVVVSDNTGKTIWKNKLIISQ